jgi:site-specific DNA-methyltransferase (cytosine-N4-specific)
LAQAIVGAERSVALEEFARHILVHLHGIEVLNAVQTIFDRGGRPTKETLAKELEFAGFEMPRATTKHQGLLLWLRAAGITDSAQNIDHKRLATLLKSDEASISEIAELDNQERKFLRALAQVTAGSGERASVTDVRNLAERLYRLQWPADRIQTKLQPLQERGWIRLERGTRGRGAKGGFVTGTERLESEFIRSLLEKEAALLSPDLRAGLKLSFREVIDQVHSSDKHTKGKGLELLALQLSRFLGLDPRKWRLRSSRTGGAEVDLVVESAQFTFSRWQIQCKNAAVVHLEDLAKEIGIASLIKSNVIAMVTTGNFGNVLRQHADAIMDHTNLQVVLIDGSALKRIRDAQTPALEVLMQIAQQSERAVTLKSKQIDVDIED